MSFPPVQIFNPVEGRRHTHTLILLHGRGSTGEEFAEELLDSHFSSSSSGEKTNIQTLRDRLPSWRLVFPSSKELYSSTFQEEFPQWFDIASLTDPTAGPELQYPGLQESVGYLKDVIRNEVALLGENGETKLFFGGISMGFATAMWTFLALDRKIGGFVGASGWLPFSRQIKDYFCADGKEYRKTDEEGFVHNMLAGTKLAVRDGVSELHETPLSLGHGIDDEHVDVKLGIQARDVLSHMRFLVEWKEYAGAEPEGHWLKEPEEVREIVEFLEQNSGTE